MAYAADAGPTSSGSGPRWKPRSQRRAAAARLRQEAEIVARPPRWKRRKRSSGRRRRIPGPPDASDGEAAQIVDELATKPSTSSTGPGARRSPAGHRGFRRSTACPRRAPRGAGQTGSGPTRITAGVTRPRSIWPMTTTARCTRPWPWQRIPRPAGASRMGAAVVVHARERVADVGVARQRPPHQRRDAPRAVTLRAPGRRAAPVYYWGGSRAGLGGGDGGTRAREMADPLAFLARYSSHRLAVVPVVWRPAASMTSCPWLSKRDGPRPEHRGRVVPADDVRRARCPPPDLGCHLRPLGLGPALPARRSTSVPAMNEAASPPST